MVSRIIKNQEFPTVDARNLTVLGVFTEGVRRGAGMCVCGQWPR